MTKVQELAREALDNLQRGPKPGVKVEPGDYVAHSDTMVVVREGAPQWVQDMCREAHGNMFPDDHRYEFMQDALYLIADAEEYDSARDMIETDVYTSDLTAWLASCPARVHYLTEAMEEYGSDNNDFHALVNAQWIERTEVFDAVWAFLEELEAEKDAAYKWICRECGDRYNRAGMCPICNTEVMELGNA